MAPGGAGEFLDVVRSARQQIPDPQFGGSRDCLDLPVAANETEQLEK